MASVHALAVAGQDEAFIRRMLKQANMNVLRLALYQQTRDPELAAMEVVTEGRDGSPFLFTRVRREHYDRIQEKALAYLLNAPRAAPPPTRAEAAVMMEMFLGKTLSVEHLEFGWEDLSFEGFARRACWEKKPAAEILGQYHVTIVGAGFSGLLAGIQLDLLGIPYRIIERQAGIGGTWYLNDYPEARVDITSFIYQFKFEKDYPWKSHYATQAELQDYLAHIVDKYRLRDRIHLSTALQDARWDAEKAKWTLRVRHPDGRVETTDSDFVISASGLFSTPRLPDIPGIETFGGKMFHTTAWDHGYDYAGKRVAVIGTGSTGAQLVRGVAETAGSLTIYQRTPNWVNPTPGYRNPVSTELRWLLDNMPGYAAWYSYHHFTSQLQVEDLQMLDPEWRASGGLINEKNDRLREDLQAYVRSKVGDDDELYAKLIPDYAPLSRRLVVDNDWYDTLLRDNVTLQTNGIARFTETGIIANDGTLEDYDLVVLSAGFDVERYLWPVEYIGREGVTLKDLWEKDGARAHLTMTLPGFPNFAIMYGPNAGIVTGSFHSWIEVLSRYICGLITHTIEGDARSFEVRHEAYQSYNDRMDVALKAMLLEEEGGGGGYYINSFGRPGVSLPWTLEQWYALIRTPDFDEFRFE
ncbi:flavin-containing monooxygenase [Sphingopyxis panaciterrulae]|uniref:4-hydroxyacetophenone monooxygenase n=1 Tax=Sphingopyxis panaciterrulae TaxID=462372 RepID=A0A7W9EPC8_9SPHN|nr:NAD(P)/FAD-dependent oxidoreductase [Sphingopyxis panaciterrulae]MBB5705314.1 4-hydroxyacetophenone monooxygenase [Sphingopyxis panaciterrulae]